MTSASRFIVELTPPNKPENLDKFYTRISNLVRLTGQVSITSKQHAPRFNDNMNFVLAQYLLERNPTTNVLFHLTAMDIGTMIGESVLLSLKEVGIKQLLLVSGDRYYKEDPNGDAWSWFSDSYDLLKYVRHVGREWFDILAIAGYPGGDGVRSYNNQSEMERLSGKLDMRADAIYTQCVFDDEPFRVFSDEIKSKFPQVEIVPSVALFKDVKDLEKIAKYTRVSGHAFQFVKSQVAFHQMGHFGYRYSIIFLEELCRKLFRSGASKIDLCTFGNYDMAEDLIMRFEKNPPTLS